MSEGISDEAPRMEFPPPYASLIAHAANGWAYLEYYLNTSIWALADVRPALGACMTSQIYTVNGRISALLALLKIRQAPNNLISRVNKFAESVRAASEARNRIVHDMWLNDNISPSEMGKLRITADKTLNFQIKTIPVAELEADILKIEAQRHEMFELRKSILDAIATLPEMPHSKLHPIIEHH